MEEIQELRPELPPLPRRLRHLPIDERGYPVPFFVETVDGKPDHRIMSRTKAGDCIRFRLCAICGGKLGAHVTFAIGPMCAVNRISADPPGHVECLQYAVRACPFLMRPHARRRETGLPDDVVAPAGKFERRNPGVLLLWTTRNATIFRAPNGYLFRLGEPTGVLTVCEGRDATPEELRESFESGVAILQENAARDANPKMAQAVLFADAARARALLALPAPEATPA